MLVGGVRACGAEDPLKKLELSELVKSDEGAGVGYDRGHASRAALLGLPLVRGHVDKTARGGTRSG